MCGLKYLKRKSPKQINEEINLYKIKKVGNKITVQGCNYPITLADNSVSYYFSRQFCILLL